MGSCLSAQAGDEIVDMLDTAKVVTADGSLREYSVPTKVADILDENKTSTASFLCRSDELYLDRDIVALNSNGWVEIGQIYFILPQSMLDQPLKGQDMAALAVKASFALAGTLKMNSPGRSSSEKRGIQVMPVCDVDENVDQTHTIGSGFKKSQQSRNALLRNSGTKLKGRASEIGGHNKSRLAAIHEVAE